MERPFSCPAGTCPDLRGDPRERVTRAPLALVVGPGCGSACYLNTQPFAGARTGPVVGQQPAHAYTPYRLSLPLLGPDREDLGRFSLAVSRLEVRGAPVEGEPIALDWEAPHRFATRRSWVRAAVSRAVALLDAARTP
jgi:hypothetical protein